MEIEITQGSRERTTKSGLSVLRNKSNEPTFSNYDPPITRRLVEALLGISLGTIQKLEAEGELQPVKQKFGTSVEVVTYTKDNIRNLITKRGSPFKRKETAEVISVFSIKGGVGKTAFTQHVASFLSLFGKTLVIDIDAQADCTAVFGINQQTDLADPDAETDPTVAELLTWELESGEAPPYKKMSLSEVTKKLSSSLEIVPSELDLGEINYSLNRLGIKRATLNDGVSVPGELYILQQFIDTISKDYDFIIFDCPPNIETFNVAALLASNRILIPVELEAKCVRTMRRNQLFLAKLQGLHSGFSWEKILVVPNKFRNEVLKLKALAKLQDMYGSNEDFVLSEACLPYSAIIDRCSAGKQPVFVAASGIGKTNRAVIESAKKMSDLFWVILHELLDAPLERLLFSTPDQPEVL